MTKLFFDETNERFLFRSFDVHLLDWFDDSLITLVRLLDVFNPDAFLPDDADTDRIIPEFTHLRDLNERPNLMQPVDRRLCFWITLRDDDEIDFVFL